MTDFPGQQPPGRVTGSPAHARGSVDGLEAGINIPQMSVDGGTSDQLYLAHEWNKLLLSRAKLKQSSNTSALLSGFAMVAMVEVELSDTDVDTVLLAFFSVVTTILVATHLFALMVSTCILPRIATTLAHKPSLENLKMSPHVHVQGYIEVAWIFSTWIGIVLFLVDVVLLSWVKFHDPVQSHGNSTHPRITHSRLPAAYASTGVMAFCMIIFFVFAVRFYKFMTQHSFDVTTHNLDDTRQLYDRLMQMADGHGGGLYQPPSYLRQGHALYTPGSNHAQFVYPPPVSPSAQASPGLDFSPDGPSDSPGHRHYRAGHSHTPPQSSTRSLTVMEMDYEVKCVHSGHTSLSSHDSHGGHAHKFVPVLRPPKPLAWDHRAKMERSPCPSTHSPQLLGTPLATSVSGDPVLVDGASLASTDGSFESCRQSMSFTVSSGEGQANTVSDWVREQQQRHNRNKGMPLQHGMESAI